MKANYKRTHNEKINIINLIKNIWTKNNYYQIN